MKKTLLFPLFFLPFIFSGCGTTPCASGSLYFGLIGFTDTESQNIILRRYQKGQNFTSLIDTLRIQPGFRRQNDTLEVSSIRGEEQLLSAYDYEVWMPSASRLYRITNITEIQGEMKHSIFNPKKDGCINKIPELAINGQLTKTTGWNTFYLVR